MTADSLMINGDPIHTTLPDSIAAHPETTVPDSDGNVTPDGSDNPDPSGDPDGDSAAAPPASSSPTVTKQEEEDNDE